MVGWVFACSAPVEPTVADVGLGYEAPEEAPPAEVALVWPEFGCFGLTAIEERVEGMVGEQYTGFADGHPTWVVYEGADVNGNGLPESVITTERDAAGNAVRVERSRSLPEVVIATYDDRGNVLTYHTDGYAGVAFETQTWDPNDELLHYTWDLYADDRVDYELAYVRDAEGNPTSATIDDDGDGDVDQSYQWTYDDQGRPTFVDLFYGGLEPEVRYTYTYTDPVRRVGALFMDQGLDGVVELIQGFEYDLDGNLVYLADDDDADGVWEYETTYTFDPEARRTSETRLGAVSTYASTWSYDTLGRIERSTVQYELYGELRIDELRVTTYLGECQ
ncbi:MAG: hypothetical protein ABMA64_26365 [Myxococcota bacterium]